MSANFGNAAEEQNQDDLSSAEGPARPEESENLQSELPKKPRDPRLASRPNEEVRLHDGRQVWLSRSVAAVAVLVCFEEESQAHYVAVSRRGPGMPDFQGYLGLCGGYLDWDETMAQAAVREVYEESGLNLYELQDRGLVEIPDQPYHISSDPSTPRQNVTGRFYIEMSLPRLPELTVEHCEPGEADEALWLKLDKETLAKESLAFNHNAILFELNQEKNWF